MTPERLLHPRPRLHGAGRSKLHELAGRGFTLLVVFERWAKHATVGRLDALEDFVAKVLEKAPDDRARASGVRVFENVRRR
jgi:hypothetical protein